MRKGSGKKNNFAIFRRVEDGDEAKQYAEGGQFFLSRKFASR